FALIFSTLQCLRLSGSITQSRLTTGGQTILHCSVLGFYPQKVQVSWLRDGVEVSSDVSSTDVLAKEDWSFQVHSYLELTPKTGEQVKKFSHRKSIPDRNVAILH
ncbi:H-2 class II histocompatibility antigen, A-S beta chain-like, partial [Limanda limanda]|uniref:H-2 class II histocompatibility antigen, A-S beta chain-like n=1 Tax=Limanda limanda TaxID=27771 RepID=UPI0029C7A725